MNYTTIIKETIKKVMYILHIDITSAQRYDRATYTIMKKVIKPNTVCVDIGCHVGEILDNMLALAPNTQHFAFEPIPELAERLRRKYKDKPVTIFECALSDYKGESTFQHVLNAQAYSGLQKRRYDVAVPNIREIAVKVDTLDTCIPPNIPIGFIKIDVEGGEFSVLKGAKSTITAHKPFVIFECGLGASDYYGTKPADIFNFINDCGLSIITLSGWLAGRAPCSREKFCDIFDANTEYYFVAFNPQQKRTHS